MARVPAILDDHRSLGATTLVALTMLAGLLAGALALAGRGRVVPGVVAGAGVAAVNVALLMRGLSRFARGPEGLGPSALTGALLSRFVIAGGLLGVVMSSPRLDPVGVVAGFLLLPVALLTVGVSLTHSSLRAAASNAVGDRGH